MASESTEVAGGCFCLSLWSGRYDLDFCTKSLGMASHNASSCSKCPASSAGPMLYTDIRPNASWVAARYTDNQYKLNFPNRHRIFRSIPGFGIHMYIPDILHTKHLGTDAYFLASVIVYIIRFMMPGDEPSNLKSFVLELKYTYKKFS